MTGGSKAVLFFAAFAAAIVLGAGSRIASAQAAGPPQPPDLAAGITEYANSEVDAAMAESAAVVSQVTGAELPSASPTPTADVQTTAAPPSPPRSPPTGDTISPLASTGDPVTTVAAGPVEIVVAQEPIRPTPVAGAAGWPLNAGPVALHDLEQSAQEPKSKVVTHASRSTISRSAFLRVKLRTSATALAETSSSSARTMARSSVRSSGQSSGSGGRSQRPAGPKAPLPFSPLPNAPAPNSGASQTGGGGGQGALLIFFVPLAALVIFGIHRLLRKVHWSSLRMPRRGAVLPWRPG
jgi:hypothetical protein